MGKERGGDHKLKNKDKKPGQTAGTKPAVSLTLPRLPVSCADVDEVNVVPHIESTFVIFLLDTNTQIIRADSPVFSKSRFTLVMALLCFFFPFSSLRVGVAQQICKTAKGCSVFSKPS